MVDKVASVFRAGDTYVATASSRAREGYWQTIHASEILKSPTAAALGQLALDALGISGSHKRFLDGTMPTIAARRLGFRSEKSFVAGSRCAELEMKDGRIRVIRTISDVKYKAFMYTEDMRWVDAEAVQLGEMIAALTSGD